RISIAFVSARSITRLSRCNEKANPRDTPPSRTRLGLLKGVVNWFTGGRRHLGARIHLEGEPAHA
ncbi:MAG TPA: hypothetical protein VMF50_01270, partial [Candidatus Binataceae bacterium]|nr:hypothetical protein [Candidatus Binataceae bacterium]